MIKIDAIDKEKYYGMTNTLCFECQNACGGCSWSDSLEPVPGWTAETSTVVTYGKPGYHIFACPEYVPDKPSKNEAPTLKKRRIRNKAKDLHMDGCFKLMEACMARAGRDYIEDMSKGREMQSEVRRFIQAIAPSKQAYILKKLDAQAEKYRAEAEARRQKQLEDMKKKRNAAEMWLMHELMIHAFVVEAMQDFLWG